MCDKIVWVDLEWPLHLRQALCKLWMQFDNERDSRIHGNVEYATKNYKLILEKRELERKNLELHRQLGNTLEHVAEVTTGDLELETAKREKAEQEVAFLKEETKKLECSVAALKGEKKQMELETGKRLKTEEEVATLKAEKKQLEYYVADLLKMSYAHKEKMRRIAEITRE